MDDEGEEFVFRTPFAETRAVCEIMGGKYGRARQMAILYGPCGLPAG